MPQFVRTFPVPIDFTVGKPVDLKYSRFLSRHIQRSPHSFAENRRSFLAVKRAINGSVRWTSSKKCRRQRWNTFSFQLNIMKDKSLYIDRKYDMAIWQLEYCSWIPFWHFFLWKKRPRTTGPYRVCIKHFKRMDNSNLTKPQERHLRCTIISYNAVISACSGHWQVALSLLRDIEGWVCTEW